MGKEYNYNIKITGSGTRDEIISALQEIIKGMKDETVGVLDGAVWEDETLLTEIDAK